MLLVPVGLRDALWLCGGVARGAWDEPLGVEDDPLGDDDEIRWACSSRRASRRSPP